MSNNNNNWGFGLGLLAGAAFGYWLNSQQGREVRDQVQTKAVEYGNQANEYVTTQSQVAREKASEYYQKGKENLKGATSTAVDTYNTGVERAADFVHNTVDGAEGAIKRNVAKARNKLTTNKSAGQVANKVEETVEENAKQAKHRLKTTNATV